MRLQWCFVAIRKPGDSDYATFHTSEVRRAASHPRHARSHFSSNTQKQNVTGQPRQRLNHGLSWFTEVIFEVFFSVDAH